MTRHDGRNPEDLRETRFRPTRVGSAAGACVVTAGRTTVLCTATIESGVPPWLQGKGLGWVTAEYAMLPASTGRRKPREGRRSGSQDGRGVEIQRLIGRALRPAVDRSLLGERTILIDCDVLEADGGTRTASINGAWFALVAAGDALVRDGVVNQNPVCLEVGALSVGIVNGEVVLDLDYVEDSNADGDMNIVMTGDGRYLEVQASAEGRPFSAEELNRALELARSGIVEIGRRREAARAIPPEPLFGHGDLSRIS